jgi:hypothetical protein
VTFIAPDWSEIRVRLPLSWRTRNYVGTIFGGSLYASVDPYYMLMLIERLGPGYVVWDKVASIRFRRPGTSTLTATFRIDDDEVSAVKAAVAEAGGEVDRAYVVELVDEHGKVHAVVEKVIYVATKDAYRAKRAAREAVSA